MIHLRRFGYWWWLVRRRIPIPYSPATYWVEDHIIWRWVYKPRCLNQYEWAAGTFCKRNHDHPGLHCTSDGYTTWE